MTEDSLIILDLLREARLGWIADELAETLALGKQVTKRFREAGSRRSSQATTVEAFSAHEEMELIVETLAHYFIVIPRAWRAARHEFGSGGVFSDVSPERNLQRGLIHHVHDDGPDHRVRLGVSGENREAFTDFSAQYERQTLPKLWEVLSKLWPDGPEGFSRRFPRWRDLQ